MAHESTPIQVKPEYPDAPDDGLSGAINKVWELLETEPNGPTLYRARRIVHELNKRGYLK